MSQEELLKLKEKYPEYEGKRAHNMIDLTGQTKGKLLVLYRTLNKENVQGSNRVQWVCECQCENKTICIKSSSNLNSGNTVSCGCEKGQKTEEFQTGDIFGFWEIIDRAPNRNGYSVYYKCKCLKCNETETEVSRRSLVSGASTACQKCRQKKMVSATIKDETNNQYGYLYVNRQATDEEKPNNSRGIYWNCTCLKCGRTNVIVKGDYLRNGDTKSCGCLLSFNEGQIALLLNQLNLKYKQQYTFSDLSSTGRACDKLLFDFGVLDEEGKLLYLIEYDGIQHFIKSQSFNEDKFENTTKNDKMKNQYCFRNNIPFIRIPYDMTYNINDLKLETTHFLLTKENEKNYYDSRIKT